MEVCREDSDIGAKPAKMFKWKRRRVYAVGHAGNEASGTF